MKIDKGKGTSEFGTGINIEMSGEELAHAVSTYVHSRGIHIDGSRTITVNGELCESASIYVDPCGSLIIDGRKISGRTGVYE